MDAKHDGTSEIWDERYRTDSFVYGESPNAFLRDNAHILTPGRTLCLAEGEGRNAVFLASLGHDVLAVDQSPVGLAKAEKLAWRRNLPLRTVAADLGNFDLGANQWDSIVSIFAHVPSALRRNLHRRIAISLRPGGVLILEAYTLDQLGTEGIGGPPCGQEDLFLSLKALRMELAALEEVHGVELVREINEGVFHKGQGAVVQYIGRRA